MDVNADGSGYSIPFVAIYDEPISKRTKTELYVLTITGPGTIVRFVIDKARGNIDGVLTHEDTIANISKGGITEKLQPFVKYVIANGSINFCK